MKKIVFGATIILVVVLIALFLTAQNSGTINVKTVTVEQGPLASTVRATGRVTSARESQVSALTPGQIVSVQVKEGQNVAAGAVLVRLDGRDAEARMMNARAALQEAQEKVEQMTRTVEGLRQVWQVGGVSLQELQDAETQLQLALADRSKADAELRSARLVVEKLNITAPFLGIVTKNSAHVGEWAAPGSPLITIADTKEREIHVFVDESDAGLIALRQKVEVSSDAFPDQVWSERVIRIDPAVQKEGTANTVTVRVSLQSDLHKLRLGQQVDAKIQTAYRENAIKLPFEALIAKDGKTFVAVATDGKVQLVSVVAGIEDMTHIEITEGIQAGREVVLTEGKRLKEGQRVRVVQDTKR